MNPPSLASISPAGIPWRRYSFWLGVAVPLYAALPFAVGGRHADPFFGVAIGAANLIAVKVGPRLGNGELALLPKPTRARVRQVERSGTPSGDQTIDSLAVESLRRASMSPRNRRIGLSFFLLVYAVVPLVAAVRVSWWWLLSLISLASYALAWRYRRRTIGYPWQRLARLEAALHATRPDGT